MKNIAVLGTVAFACVTSAALAGPNDTYPKWLTADDVHAFSFKIDGKVEVFDMQAALNKRYGVKANCAEFSVIHDGVTFCFANKENKAEFELQTKSQDGPQVVQFGARCTGALASGSYKVLCDPRTAYMYKGNLYCWGSMRGRETFAYEFDVTEKLINLAKAQTMIQVGTEFGKIVPNKARTN